MISLPAPLMDLLNLCIARDASDLHLSQDQPPWLRCQGRLQQLDGAPPDMAAIASQLSPRQRAMLDETGVLDLALAASDGTRFRGHLYQHRGMLAATFRRLESKFRALQELGLPESFTELTDLQDGLVLMTGPTGSGKTTTLATILDAICRTRACHVVTIEDPIEYLYRNGGSLVHQRELHNDVPDFPSAVRAALREDPDVILIGEMRDLETMRAAITAAETGHLVFSTLHTGSAVGAMERLLGMFPAAEQPLIAQQISMVLRVVISQRLVVTRQGNRRVPAVEVLRITPAVANMVRQRKTEQMYSVMENARGEGMQTMEQSLAMLATGGQIKPHEARRQTSLPEVFDRWMKYYAGNGGAR
ncbi:MAG: PilT/PilU family type 4a pilus ATPase [Planctomycetes bacterium]|nr:PilT/PilU family type 4a pilus ATPase [Planctomycetota bacterium]